MVAAQFSNGRDCYAGWFFRRSDAADAPPAGGKRNKVDCRPKDRAGQLIVVIKTVNPNTGHQVAVLTLPPSASSRAGQLTINRFAPAQVEDLGIAPTPPDIDLATHRSMNADAISTATSILNLMEPAIPVVNTDLDAWCSTTFGGRGPRLHRKKDDHEGAAG